MPEIHDLLIDSYTTSGDTINEKVANLNLI